MNILFHSRAFPPGGGGVGAYIANMAEALAECGHRVVIATGGAPGRRCVENRGRITILRRYEGLDFGSSWACEDVLRLCDRFSIDLIEGEDYFGDCARLLRKRSRPPILIKVHSCNVLRALHASQVLFWWQPLMIRAALLRQYTTTRRERFCIEHADMLLGPCARIFEEMARQGVKLPPKRHIVPNPIRPNRITFDQEAPVPRVLFVGRKDFGKGIQYLPGMVSGLADRFPDLEMMIAGPDSFARGVGSMQKWLEKKMAPVGRHVRLYGSLPKRKLMKLYRQAWVVVLPSRWDTFPTVLLEAMSWGKPIVASPYGGMPEMLDGTACRTAAPGSGEFITLTRNLLESRKLRKAAGGRLFAKAWRVYRPEAVARRYLEVIDRL